MAEITSPPTASSAVLHVEDSDYFARTLHKELTDIRPDLRIDRAETLVEALTLMEASAYDCILMDLNLPDCSGLIGVQTIRERFPSVPIVALTSREDTDLALNALESGVQDYLFKTAIDGPLLDRSIRYAVQRSELESRLRHNERQFRRSFDQAPNGSAIVDLGGFILQANQALCGMLGCKEDDLVGTPIAQLATSDDSADLSAMLNQTLIDNPVTARATVRCHTTADDFIWVDWSCSIMRDESEEPLFAICHMIDITASKRNAEALTQSVEKAARLEASNAELEQIAAIAAHELREPLRKVQALGDRLAATAVGGLGDRAMDYLQRMQGASARMQTLLDSLLDYSAAARTDPAEHVDMNEVAEKVISDLELVIAESGGTVELGHLPSVDGDHIRFGQLLRNLISNALKFHRPDVAPRVVIDGELINTAQSLEEPMCRVTVTDNGIGFEESQLEKMFTVFGRLHGVSTFAGTGMGLPLCAKIAQRHRGEITATSTPGVGSTFTVTLPVSKLEQSS